MFFKHGDGVRQLRKRRVGHKTNVYHIGALLSIVLRDVQSFLWRLIGRVDNLTEDNHIAVFEVVVMLVAEKSRQVFELLRAALKRHAEMGRQLVQLAAKTPRQNHTVKLFYILQTAHDDIRCHHGRNIQPQIAHLVSERIALHIAEYAHQASISQLASQK